MIDIGVHCTSICAGEVLAGQLAALIYITCSNYSSQIPDLIEFEERLDNSLQRDLVKIEHVRMRLAHEGLSQDLVDMELIELKFIFDRSVSHLFYLSLREGY